MRILGTLLLLFISTVAYAGGGGDFQQEQQSKIIINVPPSDNGGWLVPVIVGGLGLAGTLGAAYINRSRITKGKYGKKSSEK